jgi:type I restriction enzyme R subunit
MQSWTVSSEAHQNQMMQILSNPQIAQGFARVVLDMLISKKINNSNS